MQFGRNPILVAILFEQARKPRSYASPKLRLTHLLTGVKCRATSVAKNTLYVIRDLQQQPLFIFNQPDVTAVALNRCKITDATRDNSLNRRKYEEPMFSSSSHPEPVKWMHRPSLKCLDRKPQNL